MLLARSLALTALAALALPALSGTPSLRWKEKTHALDALPAGLPPEVAEAADVWGAWADEKGYRLELTDAADCLLVVPKRQRSVDEDLALIGSTIRHVDGFLPARTREPEAPEDGGKPEKPKSLEDFDLPPLKPEVSAPRLAHQLPVLLKARNPKDYDAALDRLVETHSWLRGWARDTGGSVYGLVLPHPLVGAWLSDAPDNEEWDPRNELVNRLAQLLVIDRAGQQPYWLLAGIAWNVELDVRGAIYCFPYRAGFVGIGEHAGWSPQLASQFADPPDAAPGIQDLAGLVRGKYVDRSAGLAWGTARWLIREQKERLPAVLGDLDEVLRKKGIVVHPDGSWFTIPGWEVPPDSQLEVLRRHCGRGVLEQIGEAFRKGV